MKIKSTNTYGEFSVSDNIKKIEFFVMIVSSIAKSPTLDVP